MKNLKQQRIFRIELSFLISFAIFYHWDNIEKIIMAIIRQLI